MENTNKAPVMLISVLATIPSSSQFPCYKSLERTPNGPRFLTKGVPIAMVEPALSKEAPGLLFKLFWVRHWHSQPHFNRGRFGSPSPSSHFSVLHLTRGCCSPHGRPPPFPPLFAPNRPPPPPLCSTPPPSSSSSSSFLLDFACLDDPPPPN
jgi:hypothetical protein